MRPPAFERVVLSRVGKRFGPVQALREVDLTLEAGEAVALLGDNGAGKSTLVGVLSTLVRPTTGQVLFGGVPHAEAGRSLRAEVGLLAHAALVYPELSARENLAFFGRLCGTPAGEVALAIARVGLEAAADRPAATYSRGMLQRLALARALLGEPTLVLLDEPFTGLDRGGVEVVRSVVRELLAARRIVVIVTHDLEAASGLCSRALLVRRARLLRDVRADAPFHAAGLRAVFDLPGDASPPPPPGPTPAAEVPLRPPLGFLAGTLAVLGKDLRTEARSKETVLSMALFAATVTLVFSFAFVREGRVAPELPAGILWVALVFAGTLGVQRALDREGDALRGLLLAPLPRPAILAAKTLGIASLLGATALGLVPLVALLFAVPLGAHLGELCGLILLGALGTSILGALVAVAAARTRGRHVLLPVLLFPLLVPLLIAGVRGTAAIVETPAELEVAHYWLRFLGVFDVIFGMLCLWIFEPVVAE